MSEVAILAQDKHRRHFRWKVPKNPQQGQFAA